MKGGPSKMALRAFRDFSVEQGGCVDEDGNYDEIQMSIESLATYVIGGATYVFDRDERVQEVIYDFDENAVERVESFSVKNHIYRIISSSEKKQTAVGVEITNPQTKKSLVDLVKDDILKGKERLCWEICQGWRREE